MEENIYKIWSNVLERVFAFGSLITDGTVGVLLYGQFAPEVRGIEWFMKPSPLIDAIMSQTSGRYRDVYIMTLEVRMLPY